MDQPTNTHSQNVQLPVPPTGTAGTAETTQPGQMQMQQMVEAMEQVKRNENRRKMTRRALLGTAGVGVCAGAVVAAPFIVEKAGYYTQQELDQALQNGIQQGRQELLAELRNLEGVGLGAAILIAQITKFAVVNIVKPLADLNATIGSDVLGAMASGVTAAQSALAHVNVHVGMMDTIEQLLTTWRANVSKDQLGLYAVQDVTAAEAYLEALQKKINGESKSS